MSEMSKVLRQITEESHGEDEEWGAGLQTALAARRRGTSHWSLRREIKQMFDDSKFPGDFLLDTRARPPRVKFPLESSPLKIHNLSTETGRNA